MADVALGFRPHSGWAVVVAVTAPPVHLVHRDRVGLLADGDPAQPWHAAQDAGLSPDDAAALVARVAVGAAMAAESAVAAAVDVARAAGHAAVAAAVIGEPRDVPTADLVLRSHPLLHAAEGELYRAVLADVAARLGLEVLLVPPRSIDVGLVADTLAALGRAAGPPWRVDHRMAAAAALRALGTST